MTATESPFPDISFVQTGRQYEREAVDGGRRTNELSVAPPGLDLPEEMVTLSATDDVLETTERLDTLKIFLPHAQTAFRERGLTYPFCVTSHGDSLSTLPDSASQALAERCADLSDMAGVGAGVAKQFESRAVAALHRLLGGWCVGVGAPRPTSTGPKRAVREFRSLCPEVCTPFDEGLAYPSNGDFGADALWLLGREWAGPVVFLQAKNASFSRDPPSEFMRVSDVMLHWFGNRLDQSRTVVRVLAVNSILTHDMKARAFRAVGAGNGYHVLDAVDILLAEQLDSDYASRRDVFLTV